ncbi:MAG: cobalt ECF transporter T component CbiQ [Clostridia bacterium]|nr:cobalt ECF transporter T component CbiQ [Clostridia bacterium]
MPSIDNAEILVKGIEKQTQNKSIVHGLNTTVKLIFTVVFVCLLVSVQKYDISKSIAMCIPIIMLYIVSDIPILKTLKKIWIVLPFCIFMCLGNIVFATNIKYGLLSSFVLLLKVIFSVLSTNLLIMTSGMEKICGVLSKMHFPNIFVTQILLTYRYIFVLLSEVHTLKDAYSLRAPKDRGLNIKVWGTLVGQLLLRSIDRANELYNSMQLRGFSGAVTYSKKETIGIIDLIFTLIMAFMLYILRFTNITSIIGGRIV